MNHGHPHKPSTATSATSNYGAVHPRRISLELKSAPPRPQQQLPSSSRSWHSRLEWAVFYSTELDFFSFLLPLDFLDIGYFLLPFLFRAITMHIRRLALSIQVLIPFSLFVCQLRTFLPFG